MSISSKIDAYILANNLSEELKESLTELVADCMEPVKTTITNLVTTLKKEAAKKEIHMCESLTKKGINCKCKAIEKYSGKWLCHRHLKGTIQNESA